MSRATRIATFVISTLALLASLAALVIAFESARGDRQARFDALKSHCVATIEEISVDLMKAFDLTYSEIRADPVLSNSLARSIGVFNRACVTTGVIPDSDAVNTYLETPRVTFDMLTYPNFKPLAPDPVGFEERTTVMLYEAMLAVGDVIGEAEFYTRTLPEMPFLPWQEREIPEFIFEP